MLSYMRRNAGSWMIKVLLFGVALSFVIGFGLLPTLRNKQRVGMVVAQVGDRQITRVEWDAAFENLLSVYKRVYQDRLSEEMVKQMRLRETALDNLINQALQVQEAKRLGLEVSDGALRARIRSLPYFQRDGSFARDLYLRVLQLNRLTAGEFEKQQRQEMLVEAFQDLVRSTVKVSEQELWNRYVLEQEQVRLEVLAVSPSAFEGKVTIRDEALKEYFERNTGAFLTPEKVKAAYVFIAQEPYREQVEIHTGDMEEYYDAHIEEFSSPEELRLRHILLRVPPGAEESVRQEKKKTLEGLRERIAKGEDFAELAKTYSEDVSSKEQGGDLGYVQRGKLMPELEGVAFGLKPGEVSGIVSSSHGLHLLKVEDYRASKVQPLDEVQEKIRQTLNDEKAWRLARRKAEEFVWDLKERGAFPQPGSSEGGFTVQETDYFARTGAIAGVGNEESFRQAAFSIDVGQVSEVTKGTKGYYILKVVDRKAPETPPFEEVRDRVEEQFRREQSKELARKKAEEILDKATRPGTSLKELSAEEGVERFVTDFFSRLQTYIPGIGASEEILESAFALTEESPWPKRVFEANGKFFVVCFQERKVPNREAFLAEKEKLRARHEQEKAQEILREWLSELRRQPDVKISVVEA
jgi:peptidyl-prolyl cis-trans isomerase D